MGVTPTLTPLKPSSILTGTWNLSMSFCPGAEIEANFYENGTVEIKNSNSNITFFGVYSLGEAGLIMSIRDNSQSPNDNGANSLTLYTSNSLLSSTNKIVGNAIGSSIDSTDPIPNTSLGTFMLTLP